MNNRDDFSQRTKLLLGQRTGFHCSNPNCKRCTYGANSNPSKSTCIGVAAHIYAASPNGPRFDPAMTSDERSSVDNGIWLCQNCSVIVDKDPQLYPAELLLNWKQKAEVRSMYMVNQPMSVENSELDFETMSDESISAWIESFIEETQRPDSPSEIMCDITALLAACRGTATWDDKSELKLFSWMLEHREEDLNTLDATTLYEIRDSLVQYLDLHLNQIISNTHYDPSMLEVFSYIELHPGKTIRAISEALSIDTATLLVAIIKLSDNECIIPVNGECLPNTDYSAAAV